MPKTSKRSMKSKKRSKLIKKANSGPQVNKSLNTFLRTIGSVGANMLIPGSGKYIDRGIDVAHRRFKAVSGYGQYKIQSNSLMDGDVPIFTPHSRTFRFKNREFIGDIVSGPAGSFNIVYKQDIQPTNQAMFPWLSTMARCFDEYKIHGQLFQFKTTSVDALNSTNTALGTVVMGTQYNPLNPDFTSKQEMENHEFTSTCKPSEGTIHALECDPKQTPLEHLYIRHQGQEAGSDKRLYDYGKFTLAVSGMQAPNVTIGELHVTYDIEFFKPRLASNRVGYLTLKNKLQSATSAVLLPGPFLESYNSGLKGISYDGAYGLICSEASVGQYIVSIKVKKNAGLAGVFIAPNCTGGVVLRDFVASNASNITDYIQIDAIFNVVTSGTIQFSCNVAWTGGQSSLQLTNITGILPIDYAFPI